MPEPSYSQWSLSTSAPGSSETSDQFAQLSPSSGKADVDAFVSGVRIADRATVCVETTWQLSK